MNRTLRKLCIFVLAALLSGCSVNPVTGESEFSLVSPEQEVAIGEKNFAPSQQAQGGRYYLDPELQAYVADVGRKLAAVSDRPELPYEFVVLNHSVPNAWALPGGKIAVNRGLLPHLEDEAQLAAVLGHEIVHAAARHSASQMTRGTLLGLGAQVAGMAAENAGYGDLGGLAVQLGGAAWMAKYSRDNELEADRYGMDYMARAGYDTAAAVKLQETFVRLNADRRQSFFNDLFASHPPSESRVAANRARAQSLPGGKTYRDRYQKEIAQLLKDAPAYEAGEQARKALKTKDGKLALRYLDEAIDIQPREAEFWELRGHAWQLQKNHANAEKAYTTAIDKNPGYFSPWLSRGLFRLEYGDKRAAQADLEASYQLLPTQVAAYHLGERAAATGNKSGALDYYRAAARDDNPMGQAARQKLAIMEISSAPDKYIASQAFVANNGYLQIALRNVSPVAITGIRLELIEMQNAFIPGRSSILRGTTSLSPGQQVVINTGIGPYSGENAPQYQVRIIEARVAD